MAQSPVVSAPSVINHVLIGNGVSDQFYTGLVLQAVSESPDNFRPRMEEQLSEWAVLGSIIVRGMNLSSRSSDIKSSSTAAVTNSSGNNTSDADNLDSIRMVHVPELYASGLIANADNRTVEVRYRWGRHHYRSPNAANRVPAMVGAHFFTQSNCLTGKRNAVCTLMTAKLLPCTRIFGSVHTAHCYTSATKK